MKQNIFFIMSNFLLPSALDNFIMNAIQKSSISYASLIIIRPQHISWTKSYHDYVAGVAAWAVGQIEEVHVDLDHLAEWCPDGVGAGQVGWMTVGEVRAGDRSFLHTQDVNIAGWVSNIKFNYNSIMHNSHLGYFCKSYGKRIGLGLYSWNLTKHTCT